MKLDIALTSMTTNDIFLMGLQSWLRRLKNLLGLCRGIATFDVGGGTASTLRGVLGESQRRRRGPPRRWEI
jgi:hypothetical protein